MGIYIHIHVALSLVCVCVCVCAGMCECNEGTLLAGPLMCSQHDSLSFFFSLFLIPVQLEPTKFRVHLHPSFYHSVSLILYLLFLLSSTSDTYYLHSSHPLSLPLCRFLFFSSFFPLYFSILCSPYALRACLSRFE